MCHCHSHTKRTAPARVQPLVVFLFCVCHGFARVWRTYSAMPRSHQHDTKAPHGACAICTQIQAGRAVLQRLLVLFPLHSLQGRFWYYLLPPAMGWAFFGALSLIALHIRQNA